MWDLAVRRQDDLADATRAKEDAIKSMPGLTATGGANNRHVAAPALTALFARVMTARGKVPPSLACHAATLVRLAHMNTMPPEAIVKADALSAQSAPGAGTGRPSPVLIQLAKARNTAGMQTDAQPGGAERGIDVSADEVDM